MSISSDTIILNKYHILNETGQGGMACVWLAEEIAFDKRLVTSTELDNKAVWT